MKLPAFIILRFAGLAGLVYVALTVASNANDATPPPRNVCDIVGSCHINSSYSFTDKDYINEGADKLLELGTRVIKLIIRDHLERYYSLNSKWPEIQSLVQAAKLPYYQEVFRKPFTTYVLMTFTPGKDIHYFTKGITPDDIKSEEKSFYEFAKHLLTEYKGTGKTFVLQNWEGDWVLTPPGTDKQVDPKEAQAMVTWLNARQDGVERARREVGTNGVMVVHAAEANLVDKAMQGKPSVTNSVFPHTHCDLYSYSAYDTCTQGRKKFRQALDYLASKAPPSRLYPKKNIYLGEFGWPESLVPPELRMRIMQDTVETALDWGVQYALFWELYDDGPKHKFTGRPTNNDMVGNWLIRPDGTKCPIWDYFETLFKSSHQENPL